MTRWRILLAVGLLIAWMAAAEPTNAGLLQGGLAGIRTAEITIRGCISGGNRYTLMQTNTGAMFALLGDSQQFESAVEKLSEVTGNELAPVDSNELPQLRISNLRVIDNKCPIQGQAKPAANQPPSNRNGAKNAPPATTSPYSDPGTENQKPPNANNPNITGDTGAPSPGTGNPPPKQPPQ